ncbi:J domain-containing protein [Treponema pectinovorum]|uniref:J domain-containing protein n=1 Tax=Treponema pectinovorum TaxID=164 RepID=UPI0011C7A45E|nr:J domain-containing protein [Treponema pectinovorum]
MPDSMYDKLGDLLNDALESGNFFNSSPAKKLDTTQKDTENSSIKKNKKLIKFASLEVQNACSILGINDEMSYSDAKKIYYKKLKRFHPDKNADNFVMNKITKEKTDSILKAWKVIEDWYNKTS